MSRAEDYLDGLLNSVEGKKSAKEPDRNVLHKDEPIPELELSGEEEAFLDSFEKEFLTEDDTDDFIRQFEKELDGDDSEAKDGAFPDNLDDIIDSVKEKLQGGDAQEMQPKASAGLEQVEEPDDGVDDLMVDTLGDLGDLGGDDGFLSLGGEEHAADGADPADEDQDLMSLLQSEGDFSDIGDMLKADEEDQPLAAEDDDFGDFSLDELTSGLKDMELEGEEEALAEEPKEKKRKGKKEKKAKKKKEKAGKEDVKKEQNGEEQKGGFFKNIAQMLFGGDEDEEEHTVSVRPAQSAPDTAGMTDENLQLLKELEGGGAEAEPQEKGPSPEEEKERKKQEKKAKKEQAKKEKQAKKEQAKKEKANKPKKEKKPKKPKEPDNTPPLPKKPVILIFAMAASFLVLVLVGTNYFGYAGSVSRAEQAFDLGDYSQAFREMSGMEVSENDTTLYERCRIMANATAEYTAYRTFMEAGIYDMALDSLVRTAGRCQKYAQDAEEYGCSGELEELRAQAAGALGSFGITEDRALELYALEDRGEYSAQLYQVLETAGFEVARAEN